MVQSSCKIFICKLNYKVLCLKVSESPVLSIRPSRFTYEQKPVESTQARLRIFIFLHQRLPLLLRLPIIGLIKRESPEFRGSVSKGFMLMVFELMHNFPSERVCPNGGRMMQAQGFQGTGVDEAIAEDDRVFRP